MDFHGTVGLGRTGLRVGRLGVASGYWAPPEAIEMAVERGCNYLTWGTFVRGFSPHMAEALRRITAKGQRDRAVVAMFSYAHMPFITERLFLRGLRKARLDYADVLILGYFDRPPRRRIIDGALELQRRGLIRFVGLSGHTRRLFPELARQGVYDVFHVRYNAVNSGAESDLFPHISGENQPGLVSFTATAVRKLLKARKMPPGEQPLTAPDCYRFALSHPSVDVCMTGASTLDEMRQNLTTLDLGPLDDEQMARVRRIGEHIYGKPRRERYSAT
jgi:predicted aldo/keto reductase-like oxidoreductase